MNTMNPIIEMKHICKYFPGVKALDDVSLTVQPGEIHGLVGENGAGKSTLMKILSGAYTATSGEIWVDGKKISAPTPKAMIDNGIALIYQELMLAPNLTVGENMYLGALPKKKGVVDWKQVEKNVERVSKQLNFALRADQKLSEMTLAERQMVEIGKALTRNARMLVLDEPSAVLGDEELKGMFQVLRNLAAQGVGIVYISHRLNEIFEITDHVTIIKDGHHVGDFKTSELTTDILIENMVGRKLEDIYPKRSPRFGNVSLRVDGLNRGKKVVDVSFEAREGEILGFAGLVGAGRTEVLRAIVGADKADSGQIEIYGRPVKIRNCSDAIQNGLALLTEERKNDGLFMQQKVKFNISIAKLQKFLKHHKLQLQAEEKQCIDLVKSLDIRPANIHQTVKNLSGGNQQKVVFGRWLNAESRILLIDEPTRGVDVGAKSEIYKLIADLADNGATVIVVSSELPEVLGICDRILVMRSGKITGNIERKDATEELIMKYATGVLCD